MTNASCVVTTPGSSDLFTARGPSVLLLLWTTPMAFLYKSVGKEIQKIPEL